MTKDEAVKLGRKVAQECDEHSECEDCLFYDTDCQCCSTYMTDNVVKAVENASHPVTNDVVNHPNHYCTGQYECIDVMVETQGIKAVKHFCLCNAFKYIYRHDGKNGDEDIRKAQYYLNKYLELLGDDHESD